MDRYSLLYEYMQNKQVALENDVVQLEYNVFGRGTGPYECFECLVAKCRLETANEIFADIYRVLRIIRSVNGS